MAIAQRYIAQQHTGRGGPSGLADVLEVLLDKGLVIDAFVRVSLIGIELLTVDARVVVASVDTYLRFAEAVNRLDLLQTSNAQTLGDLVDGGVERGSRSKARGALQGARDALTGGDKDGDVDGDERAEQRERSESRK
jgi:gas vesicle structural protein